MSAKDERILAAKNKVMAALGDNSKAYLANMKLWFRKVWTKEQFDLECRKMFTPEQKHLHNEFFLAILNKITQPMQTPQNLGDISLSENPAIVIPPLIKSGKKRKRSSRTISERTAFEPVELFDYLPDDPDLRPPSTPLSQPRYAAQELFLPDTGLIMGRLMVSAWENGLSTADDNVYEVVVIAVQMFLKNILSAILKARKHYKVTGNGSFFYDVGHSIQDPFTRNSVSRHIIDDAPIEVEREIASTNINRRINEDSIFLSACEELYQPPKSRINILDLYRALQDRNVIPCHSVYANNIERISQMLT